MAIGGFAGCWGLGKSGGVEQAAERELNLRRRHKKQTSGAEAQAYLIAFLARLKSCPDTYRSFAGVFSATCEAQDVVEEIMYGLKPVPL